MEKEHAGLLHVDVHRNAAVEFVASFTPAMDGRPVQGRTARRIPLHNQANLKAFLARLGVGKTAFDRIMTNMKVTGGIESIHMSLTPEQFEATQ